MREFIGKIPEGFNPAIIHLVGAIVTWWARTEGLMVMDFRWFRSQAFAKEIAAQERFPTQTKRTIKHWGKLMRALFADEPEALEIIRIVLDQAFRMHEHRNVLVHYFWPYWHSKNDEISLQSIKPDRDDPEKLWIMKYKASIDDLDDVNNEMYELYHRVLKVHLAASQKTKNLPKADNGEG